MLALLVFSLGAGAAPVEAPETVEAAKPVDPWAGLHDTAVTWEAAPPSAPEVDRAELRFRRYHRMSRLGVPFWVGGLAVAGWSGATLAQGDQPPGDQVFTALLGSAGAAVAWGGAGVMSFGSFSAVRALYDEQPGSRGAAGNVAMVLLGVGLVPAWATITAARFQGVLGAEVVTGEAVLATTAWAGALGILSGIPASFQIATNRRLHGERGGVVVLPRPDGLSVAGRW